MAKITIYLPAEIKAQMDAVEEHRPNWSAAAQRAFIAEAERLRKSYTRKVKPKGKTK